MQRIHTNYACALSGMFLRGEGGGGGGGGDQTHMQKSAVTSKSGHVQKLWTSMHNSAYDCDKKNLIAPLNSLGTLEIYHVIKTAN